MPDLASLSFSIRGEGGSADAAARNLVTKRDTIVVGLGRLLGAQAAIHLGELSIVEAREKACDADDPGDRSRLSVGACAVRGFVAQLAVSLQVAPVAPAGTALALAARLGASNARVDGFTLRDPDEARARAEAAAVADARRRAAAIAAAAGKRLGDLISVADQAAEPIDARNEVVVTGALMSPPPIVAPPQQVIIDLKPQPIETTATMVVTYAIAPT